MKKILMLGAMSLTALVCFGLCISTPKRPVVSFEPQPTFKSQIVDPNIGLSFAYDQDRSVLLVIEENPVRGIRAIKLNGHYYDAFDALASFGHSQLIELAQSGQGSQWYQQDQLAPLTLGAWHIAFGGNFAAHAEETELEHPFAFPKITSATPSINKIKAPHEEALLDYEVELCMIFDRTLRSKEDFKAAQKGVFLCADTTDRTTLLRDLPADEEHFGGSGFTDSKSYQGFFSTGPYMVIPNDWKSFVDKQPLKTVVDGTLMQYAYGADMIFDFEKIVSYSLQQWDKVYWETQNKRVKLLPNGEIKRGTALLSGTGDGVIFRPPTSANDFLCGGTAFICTGSFAKNMTGRDYVIERFIRRNVKAKTFLQPGETVTHGSYNLGSITIGVE